MPIIPSGDIRLEYLNFEPYLMHDEYGWFISGIPTAKTKSLLEESDRISKNRWIFVQPNISFLTSDKYSPFDPVIPTYWNVSGDYPKSNGVGFDDDLKLNNIGPAELEYTSYIPKDILLDRTKYNYDTPNESITSYLPHLLPGYGYIGNNKVYIYPNKVTKIIKTTETNSMYYLDVDEIDSIHPVYMYSVSGDYESLKEDLKNYVEDPSGTITIESKLSDNSFSYVASGIYNPYSPIQVIDVSGISEIENSYMDNIEYVTLDGTITNIPKTHTYINLKGSYIHVDNPPNGYIVIIYNKRGYNEVVPNNVDLSPITWDSNARVLSIIDSHPEPWRSYIYIPTDRVNNTNVTIPVVVNIRDANGVPVSGVHITTSSITKITDIDGNELVASVEEEQINGIELCKIRGLPPNKYIVVNDNRAVGYTYKQNSTIYIEKPPLITPSGVTNEYGTAYLDIKVKPYMEPVSELKFNYAIDISGGNVIGENNIEITVERNDIISDVEANKQGQYLIKNKIPKLNKHVILRNISYNNIVVSGWIFGQQVRVFKRHEYIGTRTNYEVLNSYPSGNLSVIQSYNLSGDYVIVYDEVEPTCL